MAQRRSAARTLRCGFTLTAVCGVALGLTLLGGGVASAASSPAPDMRMPASSSAPDTHMHMSTGAQGPHFARATPAIALVTAFGDAQTAFIKGPGQVIRKPYQIDFSAANGEYLNDNGVLVASFGPSTVTTAQLHTAVVNDIFRDVYNVTPPANNFSTHTIKDPAQNAQLQSCYKDAPDSPCVILSRLSYRVYPNHVKSGKGLPADVLSTNNDLIVLRAGGNVPTDLLQPSLPNGMHNVYVIGFMDVPSIDMQPVVVPNHLTVDASGGKLEEPAAVKKALGANRYGAAVIDAEDAAAPLVGMFSGGAGDATVTLAGKIQSTLSGAGISPARGAIDENFVAAETYYEAHHYSHAVGDLAKVLKVDPQNAVASIQFADSKKKANTPADLSSSDQGVTTPSMTSSGTAWWVWVLIGVGALVLVAVGTVLWRRRGGSRPQGPGGGGGAVSLPADGRVYVGQQPSVGYASQPPVSRAASGVNDTPAAGHETTTRVLTPLEVEAPLQAFRKQRHCTQCAAALSPNARFCGYCAHPTGS